MTWPGFQALPDGRTRLFLQMTAKPTFGIQAQADRLVLLFEGCRIAGRNNRRPLETRYFDTPVIRASLKRQRRALAWVLELRREATPNIWHERSPSGYFFVIVEFDADTEMERKRGGDSDAPVATQDTQPTPPVSRPVTASFEAETSGTLHVSPSEVSSEANTRRVEAGGGARGEVRFGTSKTRSR